MVLVLLVLAAFGVWMYALADVVRDRDGESRTLSQTAWTPIVFCGFAPGAIGWLVLGRPQTPAQPGDHDGIGVGAVPETSTEFRERVRARAEEQRRRYAEQRQRSLGEGSAQ